MLVLAVRAKASLGQGGSLQDGSRTAKTRTASPAGFADGPDVGMNHPGSVQPNREPLGRLVAAFKTVSTRRVNDLRSTPGAILWQRNYYERVVRNDKALQATRRYIITNPSLHGPAGPIQS